MVSLFTERKVIQNMGKDKGKSGPTIRPHARGGFYTTLTVGGKKKFIYGSTEEETLEKYIDARYKSGQGYNVTDNPKMKDYSIRWYNTYKRGKGAIKTREMYINAVEVHIIPALGAIRVRDITTTDVQELLNSVTSSYSLQHKVRITLNQIFKKAVADRLIPSNPVTGTEPVETPEPIRRFYTPEQRAILIDVLHDRKIFPLVFGILNTGMRATEAIALMQRRDLDLDNCKIHVIESTEFKKSKPKTKGTKTKRGVREIPIPSTFAAWLERHVKTVKSLYVFPGHHGGQMGQSELKSMQRWANVRLDRWFDVAATVQSKENDGQELTKEDIAILAYIKNLGIKNIDDHRFKLHFKALRHTYCTELFDLGVDEVSAAAIMGHSVSVMREIYTHIQKERKIQTAVKIEDLYAGDVVNLQDKIREKNDS